MNESRQRAVDVLAEAMTVAVDLRDRLPVDSDDGLPYIPGGTELVDALNHTLKALLEDDLERLGLGYGDLSCWALIERVRES
jgi:hypothetical protein